MTSLLLVPEVAATLRLSVEHVRRLIRRGDLAAVNVGTPSRPIYRIPASAIDEYIEVRRTDTDGMR